MVLGASRFALHSMSLSRQGELVLPTMPLPTLAFDLKSTARLLSDGFINQTGRHPRRVASCLIYGQGENIGMLLACSHFTPKRSGFAHISPLFSSGKNLACSHFAQKRSDLGHISPLFSSDALHRTPKGDSSGPNPPAFLTRNRWAKCSVQVVG